MPTASQQNWQRSFVRARESPTAQQWWGLIEAPDSGAISVVNFVKFRREAIYEADVCR